MLIHSAEITGSVQFNNTDVSGITSVAGFASTGSNQFNGNQSISGSITSNGTITAQTLVVQTVTSSVEFVTGSTRNGSLSSNTHQFTGSVDITGSLGVSNISNTFFPFKSGSVLGQSLLRQTDTTNLKFGEDIVPTSPNARRFTINGLNYAELALQVSGSSGTQGYFMGARPGGNFAFINIANNGTVFSLSSDATAGAMGIGAGTNVGFAGNVGINWPNIYTIPSKFYVSGSTRLDVTLKAGTLISDNHQFTGSVGVSGSITSNGTITAQTLVIQTVTSSIEFVTGSTRNGSIAENTHQFTGSVLVSGSVGIGTSTPTGSNMSSLLHVAGNSAVLRVGPYYSVGGDRDFVEIIASSTDTKVTSPNERFIIENTAGNIILSASGSVGIGTINPSAKLDVAGTSKFGTTSANTHQFTGSMLVSGSETINGTLISTGKIGVGASISPVHLLEVSSAGGSQRVRVGTLQNNNNTSTFEAITTAGVSTATSAWFRANAGGNLTIGTSTYTKANGDSGDFNNLSSESATTVLTVNTSGLKFTNGASSLNFYEEGSWTPTLSAGTVSYSSQSGTYVRIGSYVFVRWGIRIASISGQGTGNIQINGLPFTSVNWGGYQEPNISVSTGGLVTSSNAGLARMFVGGTSTSLFGRISNNSDTPWLFNDLQAGAWIIGEIYYNA